MSKGSVLVVDDDAEVRVTIADVVQSLGYSCLTASDGFEALDILKDSAFEVIVSDIHMPRLNGLDFMKKVKETRHKTSFLIVTGYFVDYPYEKVIAAGADDFIGKPFSSVEVKYKLDRIVNERRLARDNARLLEEQLVLNDKLSAIIKFSRNLTADMNFDRLFELVISNVTEIMEAERTSLYLIDWKDRQIVTKVSEQVAQIRLPLGHGISGRVAESGETINVDDASRLPCFDSEYDSKHGFHTRSVLCMPICNRSKERIGVLQVINRKGGDSFNNKDEVILEAISSQVAIALENSFLLDELQTSFESSIRTLAATVDARHPLTAGHSKRVTEYSIIVGKEMGLSKDELEVIKYAALLHDIGKIGIRDDVLLKSGEFTPEERAEMNTHPVRTREILENFYFPTSLRCVPLLASQHHEKVNGQGYPEGLIGDELPIGSKIIAVADVFDALTSRRDYAKYYKNEVFSRNPIPLPKVIEILKGDSGSHFDANVVATFLRCLPQIFSLYRGIHFSPDYVDEIINSQEREGLSSP